MLGTTVETLVGADPDFVLLLHRLHHVYEEIAAGQNRLLPTNSSLPR